MNVKTVRLTSNDERWLEMTVENDRATARVGGPDRLSEPFDFNLENLAFVLHGVGYQAWGQGGHFAVRRTGQGYAVEFQGTDDRCPAVARLSAEELRQAVDQLHDLAPSIRASLL